MSLTETIEKSDNLYLSIIKGTLMQKVTEETPGAKKRDYETSSGGSGTKWEIHHKNLTGLITNIEFQTSDFGEQCRITILNSEDSAIVSTPTDSRYFTDFAKKISNIDLSKFIVFNPYDFTNKEDKRIQGLSITQNGDKIMNYFWDAEKKKVLNKFPNPDGDGDGFDTDDWKMYFLVVKKFLKKHVQTIKFPELAEHPIVNEQTQENDPDDLPF